MDGLETTMEMVAGDQDTDTTRLLVGQPQLTISLRTTGYTLPVTPFEVEFQNVSKRARRLFSHLVESGAQLHLRISSPGRLRE